MKVLILAGGFGIRLSEETQNIPKPMMPIDNKPYSMAYYENLFSLGGLTIL